MKKIEGKITDCFDNCTDKVVGSDDVAASDNIGMLNGIPG